MKRAAIIAAILLTVPHVLTAFVKHGDPNGAGFERWPAFDTKQRLLMQLGDAIEARTILEPRKRDLFQTYAADRGRLSVF